MDLAPLLYVVRASEMPLLFLIQRLLASISMILAISSVSCVDFLTILLLLRGPVGA
jgi:hypothetical protein